MGIMFFGERAYAAQIGINLDKKEYLYSPTFGDGLKLKEFGSDELGINTALLVLLAESNGRGGGDFLVESPLVGRWVRDRITIAGDYGDPERGCNLYELCDQGQEYQDISLAVLRVLLEDCYYSLDLSDFSVFPLILSDGSNLTDEEIRQLKAAPLPAFDETDRVCLDFQLE